MLESLAAWVLRTYVGEYVENLNTDQLSIGYGTVELENLPLRKTALQALELPLEVKSGFIGRLKLSIPFRHPKSEPWIIHIDKLYLIAGPLSQYQYDEEQEKKRERERKQKQLDGLEMQWQFGRSKENASETWWTSLYSSLSTTIMENLQLVVNDVHVRYEDNVLNPENPFAVGITIEKLAMESANENWEPEFLVSESKTKFKLIEIQKFALYWDSDTSLVGDLPSKDLDDALHRVIGRHQGTAGFSQHEYILHPLTAQVKLQRNCSAIPLRSKDEPRFVIDIHLEDIAISLADVQYQNLSKLMEEFQRHFRGQKYRKWRPLCPKKHNAKVWWQFAGKCILNFIQERNKRQTWSYTAQRAQTIVKYVNVYTKHLTEQAEDINTTKIQNEIEDELSFEELKVLRFVAVGIVRKEEELRRAAEIKHSQSHQSSTQTDANSGWLSGWWGWYGTAEDNTVMTSSPPNIEGDGPQTEEEEQFLEEIQEGGTDDSIFKRDTVFAHLNFHLDSGHFKLITTKSHVTHGELQPLVEILYDDVRWMSRVCPRNSTWQSNVSLRSILVKDKMSEGNIFKYLVSAQPKISSENADTKSESIFELEFEKMPKISKIGYSIKMKTQPLQIVYNPATIERISDFFRRQTVSTKKADLHVIEQQILDAAWARYEELKTQTKTGLYHAMDDLLLGQVKTQDKRWNIELFIAAPQIVLPESFQEKNASMILLDLGNLSFVTKSGSAKTSQETQKKDTMDVDDDDDSFVTPLSTPPSEEEMDALPEVTSLSELKESFTAESLADKVYDRYTLELADVQVLVAKIEEYRKRQSEKEAGNFEEFSIVDKFTISLQLERRLIFTADPKWPSITVSGDLPKLNLYFSEIKVQAMWKCMANLWRSKNSAINPPNMEESMESSSNLLLDQTSKSLLDLTEADYYKLSNQDNYDDMQPSLSHNSSETSLDTRQKLGQLSEESCLVLGQFCIKELCVYLSGRGRVIAELKVDGVKSSYNKRPYDMSLSLLVYDISLVDHVQTYGPEFEMLLSSHNVRGEQGITRPVHPVANKVFILDCSENPEQLELDSVITLDYNQINPDSPSSTSEQPMRIASIQFNTVKFIANQETIVELMNFVNTLFPSGNTQSAANLETITENEVAEDQQGQDVESPVAMEITATFHQLHVQFIRGLTVDNQRLGRKVADINIIDLWTQVTLGDKQVIEGSLGGLHVVDVTPEDILHREVLSLGVSNTITPNLRISTSGVFQDFDTGDSKKAFTFTLVKPKQSELGLHPPGDESLSRHIRLSVHMASAHYVHTHRFISELTLCVDDFSSHANAMAQSLRSAATSMAIGLVTKQKSLADGIDYFSSSFTHGASGTGLEPRSSSRRPSVDSWDGAVERSLGPITTGTENKRRVYVHVTIETPVIILPRTSSSQERLVAHLGRIVIYNTHLTSYDQKFEENCRKTSSDSNVSASFNEHTTENDLEQTFGNSCTDFNDIDRVYIDITDMSLYSLGLAKAGPQSLEIGSSDDVSEHILHDTALRLVVDRCCRSEPGDEDEGESLRPKHESSKPTIHVSGRVTKPLQLVLSSRAYQQLLSTNDTLSGKTERDLVGSKGNSTVSSAVTSPLISPVPSFSHLNNPNQYPDEPVPMNIDQSSVDPSLEDLTISSDKDRTPIRASFDIPHLNIELRGELKDGEKGIVNVFFQDFGLLYKNTLAYATCFDVSLGGLIVEDLLQSPDSLYRNMMVSSNSLSKTTRFQLKRNEPMSKSCPDISSFSNKDAHSTSLPMALAATPRNRNLRSSSPLRPMFQHRRFARRTEELCDDPEDEPEGMNDSVEEFLGERNKETGDNTLVKIKALMVDRNSTEYIIKYDKTDRFIEVDFNSLDTTVNLQTWVVFLEFFGIGRAPEETNTAQQQDPMKIEGQIKDNFSSLDEVDQSAQEHVNSQYKVRVSSLSLTLNKAKYPLAKIKIAGLSSLVNMVENNMSVKGKLMKISLMDMSPHGKMYREKFTTCGEEAMDFDYFRYGDPDPDLRYEYDMSIKLRMSAVQYVHTKRFQSELMAFVNHFSQIQESLRRMRTVAAGNEVAEASTRATRISLDISAGTPLMIFPESSTSEDLLVANFGHMTLRNQFLFTGDEGTILRGISSEEEDNELEIINEKRRGSGELEQPCLLDHMEVELVDIDLFSAVSFSREGEMFSYKRQGNKLFKETCKLDLMIERNLDWARSRAVPDMSIWGALSSMHVNLDYSQYGLILGFLNTNLGEPLEAFERPSSFVDDLLEENTSTETNLWTTFKMVIDLVNVKVELLPSTSLHNSKHFIEPKCYSLAKIDFIKSKFVFEGFSDWSKTMDLVSQDVLLYDTRHEGSNERFFKEVLRPGKQLAGNQTGGSIDALMFEVHYRDSPTRTNMTFIFNNSRITLLLDAILDIYNFIMNNWDRPTQDQNPQAVDTKPQSSAANQTSPNVEDKSNVDIDQQAENKNQKSFEMKVNVSGSEFVALQNVDVEDTDAVILRMTAVLAWRPHYKSQKPLSCSVQSLEIFSCNLSCEEETALSIIDPMAGLIELNAAERLHKRKSQGLLDATLESLPSLEVTLNSLNMRISYNDYKLFQRIAESLSKQLSKAIKKERTRSEPKTVEEIGIDNQYGHGPSLKRLQELGFDESDCIRALNACRGDVESAASWLLLNAKPSRQPEQPAGTENKSKLSGFEIRANSVCVCLIDDCGDNDVPLAELLIQNLYFWYELHGVCDSCAQCTLTADYYNRSVSGWEPLVEPWKCQVHWQKQRRTLNSPENLLVKVDAADRLDVNITSSLISMIQNTLKNWSEDYYGPDFLDTSASMRDPGPQQDDGLSESSSTEVAAGHFRKRAPFVPFLLRNQTGCSLHFATVTSSPSKVVMTTTGLVFSGRVHNSNISDSSKKLSEWRELLPGDEVPFEFKQSREKQRHKETHELKVHQLVVQLEGWEQVSPVSVDKVGAFFRQALPAKVVTKSVRFNSARVVFDIKLENGVQKVVTVKSALVLRNKTDLPLEVKLELPRGEVVLPPLNPQSDFAIPLPYVQSPLFIRPHSKNTRFSTSHLHWKDVRENFEEIGYLTECAATNGREEDNYRYCVSVQRDGFPFENPAEQPGSYVVTQPAHTLTILPPIVLVNLLPVELSYCIRGHLLSGNIKPGKLSPIYKVNRASSLNFTFSTENFPLCETLNIPELSKGAESCIRHIEIKDTKNRVLRLNAKIELRPGLSLKISIFASFWLVNDTGIPLIFKQEGISMEMAGQFDEHEMARSLTPLLFSFDDRDGSFRCQMRIGKGQHKDVGKPVWCTPFSLEYPREFTRVHSRQPDRRPDIMQEKKPSRKRLKTSLKKPQQIVNRSKTVSRKVHYIVGGACSFHIASEETSELETNPDISLTTAKSWVYDVGIDVRFGQGRFRDTRIVTFAPRYQFENRSAHTLAFQQRHFVREQKTNNPEGTLTSLPGAQVVWHWERTDLDQLLCIRLNDIPDCRWSGGFKIDRDDSSHISMRCSNGSLLFIRAEVMLKGAVFHIVFTDANQLPPPYRIDNMSEVPILFYQSRTEDYQRCLLQPKQSVPYAWDEPTLPRQLTCGIVNDGSFIHFSLEKLGEKDKLYYYNAIYIAFTHTFNKNDGTVSGSFHMKPANASNSVASELVLDVPQGTAVILSKKEPYKRTQLWRMTTSGILFNEGTSPPFDPRKPSSSSAGFVLDVGHPNPTLLMKSRKPLQLIVSKLSSQRRAYQTWSFTEDGRMRNQILNYFVGSKPDLGLYQGVDALLCYSAPVSGSVPREQQINVEKLRPGSGMLLVKVLADGPTRAVRISDVRQQTEGETLAKDWMVIERRGGLRQTTVTSGNANDPINKRTEIQIRLAGGIGISLINGVPEELVFATFNPIEMDYITTASSRSLELNIGNIQIDDQLHLTQYPVMLFVTPSSKEDCTVSEPAVRISAANEPTKLQNCEIFKNMFVSLRKLTLQVDERLLFKLLQFFGWVYNDDDVTVNQDSDNLGIETHRTPSSVSPASLKRYYFEKFLFNAVQLRVSVATVTRLPEDLKQIKSSMGLILVRLQGAVVDLESFSKTHAFDTRTALLDALSKHYSEELRGQAPFILASVDFLGNPMGLFNDVSSGLQGLVRRGNVGGLFLNVAHGLSDSAAKLTGSLSDGLWSASSDSKSLESREAMKAERQHQSSGDHLVAGFKGLGMGLVGGLTSMVTQPIEGASEKGVPGFIQGIGKGILGTFAKPTAGVLDLASGLSAAVRGSATRSSRLYQPKRIRSIRNCFGPGGAIPRFSKTNSEGQSIVLKLNANNMDEKFITSESVRTDIDGRVKVLLTNERVYFVKTSGVQSPESILVSLKFEDVLDCHHLKNETVDYVELSRKYSEPPVRVRCEAASAQKLVQKINYAKSLFEEVKHTVIVKSKASVT